MQKSGMIGQPVTVYGEERTPRKQYARLLHVAC